MSISIFYFFDKFLQNEIVEIYRKKCYTVSSKFKKIFFILSYQFKIIIKNNKSKSLFL